MSKRRGRGRGAFDFEREIDEVLAAAGSALSGLVGNGMPPAAPTVDPLDVISGRLAAGLELAERVADLGPVGLGVLAYNSLSDETRERLLGKCCPDCGEPRSACECCAECGFSPCACPRRFSLDVEGVSID